MTSCPYRKNPWIFEGIAFGLMMFLLNAVILPLFIESFSFSREAMLVYLVFWVIGGLGYGYTMKLIRARRKKK